MDRMRLASLTLLLIAPLAGAADTRSALERVWLPIAEQVYPVTEDPEVRDLGTADPDGFARGEGSGLVLLGKTAIDGTSAKEWRMRDHGERVGATLVVYWIDLAQERDRVANPRERDFSVSGDGTSTLSSKKSSWALERGEMKVTVGAVHALYFRDCSKAACPQPETRPVTTSLRACMMPRCGLPPPLRQRGFRVLDRTRYAPTEDAVLERIDGSQINELVGSTYRNDAVLGKSVVDWTGEDPAALLEQARRVGATRVLWWVEGGREEHAVYLRDCNVAPCGSP